MIDEFKVFEPIDDDDSLDKDEEFEIIKEEIVEVIPLDFDFNFSADQKVYWAEEQERAVIEYLWLDEVWLNNKMRWEHKQAIDEDRESDQDFLALLEGLLEEAKKHHSKIKREKIFKDKIEKPLNKLIENIIFSFKLFRQDIDVKSLEYDSLSFLMTKFANFDPSQKNRAYSYYGTVVKHYLIGEKKDLYKDQQNNLEFESKKEEINSLDSVKYSLGDISHLEESAKLFRHIIEELKKELKSSNISENDRRVGNAIINIFENHEIIQVYSKNNLYQIIKEYTNLQTKDITYSLSRFKSLYRISKQSFIKKNR